MDGWMDVIKCLQRLPPPPQLGPTTAVQARASCPHHVLRLAHQLPPSTPCRNQLKEWKKGSPHQGIQRLWAPAMSLRAKFHTRSDHPSSCRHCTVFTIKSLHRRLACQTSVSGIDPCLPSAATAAEEKKGWGNAATAALAATTSWGSQLNVDPPESPA